MVFKSAAVFGLANSTVLQRGAGLRTLRRTLLSRRTRPALPAMKRPRSSSLLQKITGRTFANYYQVDTHYMGFNMFRSLQNTGVSVNFFCSPVAVFCWYIAFHSWLPASFRARSLV